MSAMKGMPRKIRWSIILLWAFTITMIGTGTMRPSSLLAKPPRPESLGQIEPQGSRSFIDLPDAASFSVENLPGATVDVTATFTLPNGTVQQTFSDTLLPESMGIYTQTNNFSGSGSIETDQPVDIVNFELSESGNDAYLGIDLSGFRTAAQPIPVWRLFWPLVMKTYQGWSSVFTLQNLSIFSPGNVVVAFYNQAGSLTLYIPGTIPANGSLSFDLAQLSNLPDGYIGSVVISADQPTAVASVRLYNVALGLRTAYAGNFIYTNTLIAPALFKASDLQTSTLCVQNADTTQQLVSVNYSDGLNATATINPAGSHCFDQGTEGHAAGWSGGAIVSGSGALVAVVVVTASDNTGPLGRWSYAVADQSEVGNALAMPLLLNDYQHWTSTIHLYNYGNSAAMVTPRFVSYPAGVIDCVPPFTIPAHGTLSLSQAALPGLFGISMAYFTATQPVAAAVSFTSSKPLHETDRHFGYDPAYPLNPINPRNTCDTIREVFLPTIIK